MGRLQPKSLFAKRFAKDAAAATVLVVRPNLTSNLSERVHSWFDSLDEDQVATLAALLRPDQQDALRELFDELVLEE